VASSLADHQRFTIPFLFGRLDRYDITCASCSACSLCETSEAMSHQDRLRAGYWETGSSRPWSSLRRAASTTSCSNASAKRTIALAQQVRMKDPDAGYDPLLAARMRAVLPICVKNKVRIVTNMGAANPAAAAEATRKIARELGLKVLKVAAVTGDDVFAYLLDHDVALDNGKTIAALGNSVISANAYIGVAPIVEALKGGADVVITGRAA
jgi:hypothetical protein